MENMVIRLRVAELRGALGWTQEELAAKAGVARQTITRIESEANPPLRMDFEVLEKLADALGVAPGLLLTADTASRKGRKGK